MSDEWKKPRPVTHHSSPITHHCLTVALVGNPNTGETTCAGRPWEVVDLPGSYSLAPRSPDEMVTVDLLLGRLPGEPRPDVVVSIVDASNLDRHLYLTTQALEL